MKHQIERQRYERLTAQEKANRLHIYNKRALRTDLPQITDLNSPLAAAIRAVTPTDGSSSRRSSGQPRNSLLTPSMMSVMTQNGEGSRTPSALSNKSNTTPVATPVAAKSKASGGTEVKKKKNKNKDKKKKKTKAK